MADLLKISVAKVAAELLGRIPTQDDKARMIRGLGAAAMHYWKNSALRKLRSTSRDYVAGLQEDIGGDKATITLVGVLPNLVERGFRGGDMRSYMLEGKRVKKAKAGHRYLVVPFQHGTPGTTGRNVGAAMPPVIHKAAKQLAATVSRPGAAVTGVAGRTVLYGERLHPEHPAAGQKARRILQRKEQPWHATSIYTGMIRQEKKFAKATQTTGYTTFRVLSEKVIRGERDPETGQATQHWFHPGIKAHRFARGTRDHVRNLAKDIVASSLSHVGKKRST
jgi:hypothetical protein